MALDRDGRLRRAEIALRQGLLERAIEEHVRLAAERPDDWPLLVALGNLYLRARSTERAVEAFARVADHVRAVGAPPQVLAAYTAIMRVSPGYHPARLHAAGALKAMAAAATASGRAAEAVAKLERAFEYDPSDAETRLRLARAAIGRGEIGQARTYLSEAEESADVLLARLEIHLYENDADAARQAVQAILSRHEAARDEAVRLACTVASRSADASFACVAAAANRAAASEDWPAAATVLRLFSSRVPNHVPALLQLVEVCIDGELHDQLASAQYDLADAYLATGQARQARIIAEDLAIREPGEPENVDRFRRALVMLGEPDPDAVIEECLSGDSPFAGLIPNPTPKRTGVKPAGAPASQAPVQPAPAPPAKPASAPASPVQAKPAAKAASATVPPAPVKPSGATVPQAPVKSAAATAPPAQKRPARRGAGRTPDVLYDLGRALLAADETDRALAVFLELRADAPGYRDVDWQIARLEHARRPKGEDQRTDEDEALDAAPDSSAPPRQSAARQQKARR